jgi:integrase
LGRYADQMTFRTTPKLATLEGRSREAVVLVAPHAFRHGHAHAMFADGSDWLGHARIAITPNVYAAVLSELRREAAEAMDRLLGRGES